MKVAILTFTYPKDAIKASIGLQLIPKEWDVFWALDKKDEDMPVPERVKKIITEFPRGERLNSNEMIYGFRDLLFDLTKEDGKGYDVVIKLDSDTSIFKPEVFVDPIELGGSDFVYIRRTPNECRIPVSNGICYSMTRRAVEYLRNVDFTNLILEYNGAEDEILSHFFAAYHPWPLISQIDKFLVDWSVQPFGTEKTIAGHYGYVSNNQMLARTNEILKIQGRPELDNDAIVEYSNKIVEHISKNQ